MQSKDKISRLSEEALARLLRINFFKIGLEVGEGSSHESALVKEVLTYQGNLWIRAFNDMFSFYASGKIKEQEKLTPVISGYFISQLRKAFFKTILAPKNKSYRTVTRYRTRREGVAKSLSEILAMRHSPVRTGTGGRF